MQNHYSCLVQQRMNLFSAKWLLVSAAIATSAAIFPTAAIAQLESEPMPTTVCSYDPSGELPNPLGMRAFITVSEVGGNSVFVYEQFPSPVVSNNPTDGPATIARERTLTLIDTPITAARERVVNNPAYYAELVGTTVEQIGENGFAEVNDTLTCQDANTASVPESPEPSTPAPGMPPAPATPAPTFADLPNGNYRLASADLPFRVIETPELLESEALVYLFRKTGNNVTGDFFSPETDISVCITGTIEGNVVTGTADGPGAGSEGTIPDSDALTLGDQSAGGRFGEATLNLEGFSRINAGIVLPRESCG